jgi:hypothetical protein
MSSLDGFNFNEEQRENPKEQKLQPRPDSMKGNIMKWEKYADYQSK